MQVTELTAAQKLSVLGLGLGLGSGSGSGSGLGLGLGSEAERMSVDQGLQQKLEGEARRANEMTAKVKQVSEYLKKVCGAAVPTRVGLPNAV